MLEFLLGVLAGLFGLMLLIAYTAHQYRRKESEKQDLSDIMREPHGTE